MLLRDFNVVWHPMEMLNSNFGSRSAHDFNDFIFRARLYEYALGVINLLMFGAKAKMYAKSIGC